MFIILVEQLKIFLRISLKLTLTQLRTLLKPVVTVKLLYLKTLGIYTIERRK